MGDGLLAVFPIDEYVGDAQQVCSRVLEAARESRASVADMQYPIGDTIERFRFGVALHVGRILYGNIGGGNRLDFTCIGPAVNLAARLEKIASRLHARSWRRKDLPASAGAAGAISASFRSPDFPRPQRVYGLSTRRRRPEAWIGWPGHGHRVQAIACREREHGFHFCVNQRSATIPRARW